MATLAFSAVTASADSDTVFLNLTPDPYLPGSNLRLGQVQLIAGETINVSPTIYTYQFPAADRWSGNLADLGKLEGYENIYPVAMDGFGLVVGSSSTTDNNTYIATRWDNGVPTDLNSLLGADYALESGWILVNANDISLGGIIIGEAYNNLTGQNGQFVEFGTIFIVPVPEADTSAMLLMGAGVIGFMARRRKKTQA